MDKLKQLEIKKLIKELDYIESDFEYKSEIIIKNDIIFLHDVSIFLENNPQLKELFDKKISTRLDDVLKQSNDNKNLIDPDKKSNLDDEKVYKNIKDIKEELDNFDQNNKSEKLKKLYREIVKITHPDKIFNKKLNDIYIKANIMYNTNDIAGIYSICNDLKIDYDVDELDEENINIKINTLKERIKFIESTITWKWHYSKTPKEKEQLVFLYIKMQLQ
jgi:hypothetical protein